MATIDQLQVEITAITKDFNRQIDGVKKELGSIEGEAKKAGGGLEAMGKKASLVFAASGLAMAAGIGMAIKSFANYEQLVGGVETLFKDSSAKVLEYANNAYKTAGLSANKYMETVTSFSASLLQGLGGDTKKATEYANMAVTDMSDNANKMGTNIGMIQDAYQGFAKDNYTMLDNLKLGYGGTAGEMARLVNESGVLGDSFEATAENVKDIPFDQLVQAIHKTQEEMGIAGTTAKEASETISGSWSAVKASFENVLTGVEGSGQALSETMLNLFGQLAEKVPPIVATMVSGMFEAVKQAITEKFGEGAWAILSTLAVAIGTITTALTVFTAVTKIAAAVQAVFNAVLSANPIGLVILAITAITAALVWFFTQTEIGRKIFETAMNAIKTAITVVWNWVKDNWPKLLPILTGPIGVAVSLILIFSDKIKQAFSNALNWIKGVWNSAPGFFSGILNGIINYFKSIPGKVKGFFTDALNAVKNINWLQLGKDIVSGIVKGLDPSAIINKMKEIASSALDTVKSFLGIKSPSRVMRDQVGKMIGEGMADGIDSSTRDAVKSASKSAKSVLGAYNGSFNTSLPTSREISAKLDTNVNARLTEIDGRPMHVTVMVGEDTLVDKVVNGINTQSFMSNGTVIRV